MDSQPSSTSSFGFKKKKRPQGTNQSAPSPDQSQSLSPTATTTQNDDDDDDHNKISETLEELIALRKLKRATGGIQLERLNAGEKKRRPKVETRDTNGEVVLADGQVEGTVGGLTKGKDRLRDEPEPDPDDAHAKLRRGIQSNNFTGQTNAVDVDKHMMAYIEAELQKRKGGGEVDVAEELRALDPRDELYQIGEKYKVAKQEVEEGNVTLSASMLTAIPEVDLGIDRKLKNIEDTERAKRAYWEQRNKPKDDDGEFAAERFYRAKRAPESDADALAKARAHASGQAPEPQRRQGGGGRQQHATDDMVMDRFKKRQRK